MAENYIKLECTLSESDFKTFYYPVLIKEHHLDTFSHVNNATYLELLEEARWEFLNDNGFDLKTIHESGIGPVVLDCHIQFLKELRLRQPVIIESQMVSYEKKIGIMRQDIVDERGVFYSKATMTFGIFDLKTRKLILPPEKWLRAMGIG